MSTISESIVLFGIKNCDSVKKARIWLDGKQLEYRFHDYRVDGLTAVLLQQLIDALGVEVVLNQRSTSWRQLSDEQKRDLNPARTTQLLLENPTLIKRPILHFGNQWLVGFDSTQYAQLLP